MGQSTLLATVLCLLLVDASIAYNVTSCFVCQSPGNPLCDDPFDVNVGLKTLCSSLQFGRSTAPDQTDVVQNAYVHERISNTTVNQQFCVKLGLQYNNGTPGIIRTCHRQTDNVGDPCEFIKRETTILNVTSISECNVCSEDNCNSAGSIYVSLGMLFVGLLLSKSC